MKKFALSVILAATLASPAAAATIAFTPNTLSNPSYTTATIVDSFDSQAGPFFVAGASNTRGTETVTTGGGASAFIATDTNFTNMVNNYLNLFNGASLTLSFGSSPVQFLSFLVDNFDSRSGANIVNVTDSNNVTTTNVLSGVSGLTGGTHGLVTFNQQGGAGIKSITFSAGAGRTFSIDQITTAAPEPATWGLMLAGFGVVGTQLRRRRKRAFAFA